MDLESAIKFHSAKTQRFTDEPRATASDALTGTDVMAALGMAQAESGFGAALFFAKVGISEQDKENAIQHIHRVARKRAGRCKALAKVEGRPLSLALRQIAKFVFDTYSRCVATPGARCDKCDGRAMVFDRKRSDELKDAIFKPCKECNGRGFTTLTTTALQAGLRAVLPSLSQSSFSRHIQPMINELVTMCYAEESKAEEALKKATR